MNLALILGFFFILLIGLAFNEYIWCKMFFYYFSYIMTFLLVLSLELNLFNFLLKNKKIPNTILLLVTSIIAFIIVYKFYTPSKLWIYK